MRRLFLVLAGAAVLAAAGCGGDRTGSDIPTTTAAPQTMPTLDGSTLTPPPAKRGKS